MRAYVPSCYRRDATAYVHSRRSRTATALAVTAGVWLLGAALLWAASEARWLHFLVAPPAPGPNTIQLAAAVPAEAQAIPREVRIAREAPDESREDAAREEVVLKPQSWVAHRRSHGLMRPATRSGPRLALSVTQPADAPPGAVRRRNLPATAPSEPVRRHRPRRPTRTLALSRLSSPRSPRQQGVESVPQPVFNPQPVYPARLLARRVSGRVVVRASVGRDGRVVRAVIHRSSGIGAFDRAALAAVRRWRFAPLGELAAGQTTDVAVPLHFRIVR